MNVPSGGPSAGWYADPQTPRTEQYWDGTSWSGQRRPAQTAFAAPAATNGFAVTALVCGIVGIVLGIIPFTFWFAWILGIIAIVFGVLARKRVSRDPVIGRRGMATAGFVLGILTLVVCVAWTVVIVVAVRDGGGYYYYNY